MFCDKCGSAISDNSTFCPICGGQVKRTPPHPVVQEPQNSAPVATHNDLAMQNAAVKKCWPDWELVEKIGEGSFGQVYKAKREEVGNLTSFSAIKIIRIPQSRAQLESVRSEAGLDDKSTTAYFRGFVDDCVNEIKAMESLKGTQNIVSVEDYKVVPHENEIGWTIFIRMELLTSFVSYIKDKTLSESEVIRLGIDMCSALELCAKCNIMHRDIKPENIFVSSFGIFKLGDFGIARNLEKSTLGMSKKGTYNYMAPEIYNGHTNYDFKSDIYSLGIVLYKLVNGNRFPFIDPRSEGVTYQQVQDAFEKRMHGVPLPNPAYASDAFASIILSACAYNPNDRFGSASVLKIALTNLQSGAGNIGTIPVSSTVSADIGNASTQSVVSAQDNQQEITIDVGAESGGKKKKKKEKKKKSKGKKALAIILSIIILLAAAAGGLGIAYLLSPERKIIRALEDKNYNEALSIYNSSFNGDDSGLLENSLKERLDKIKADFTSGELEYEVASNEIKTIEDMGISAIAEQLKQVKEHVDGLNNSRTAFNTAQTMFEDGDYEGAITNYRLVIDSDSNYETAKQQLAQASDKFREQVLAQAEKHVNDGSVQSAITTIETALKTLPDDSTLTEKLNIYRSDNFDKIKEEAMSKAEEYAAKNEYSEAINEIKMALKNNEEDAELQVKLNDYTESYVTFALTQTDDFIANRKYDEAISILDAALKTLPDNEKLKAKRSQVEQGKPVALSSLEVFNG